MKWNGKWIQHECSVFFWGSRQMAKVGAAKFQVGCKVLEDKVILIVITCTTYQDICNNAVCWFLYVRMIEYIVIISN